MSMALKTFGYNLSDRFISVLLQKFDKYGKHKVGYIKRCALKNVIM